MYPATKFLCCFIAVLSSTAIHAQSNKPKVEQVKLNPYRRVDSIVQLIPLSVSQSSQGIADYIQSNFKTEKDKARAIFAWLGQNIEYDVANRVSVRLIERDVKPSITEVALQSRKGVCQHYAELFTEIAEKIGLKSYVVTGYVNVEGYNGHAWNVARIDSVWYGMENTWGAGYVRNGKFVRSTEDRFFMMKPEELIKTHMPFDPLWQMLPYVVTGKEFVENKMAPAEEKPYTSFKDSLKLYEKQNNIERLQHVVRRIQQNGIMNSMVSDVLSYTNREIYYYKNHEATDQFNLAVKYYNNSITLYNAFIEYRNKQFTPSRTDEEIKQMVEKVEQTLNTSKHFLSTVKYPEALEGANTNELKAWIDDLMSSVKKQKEFVSTYCKTGKPYRKTLFYTYNWSKN